jgi:two-component system chemotaxis response regulator CheB
MALDVSRSRPRSSDPQIPARLCGAGERPSFDVVVIASSAGGIQALLALIAALPIHFPLPILICQHVLRSQPSRLPAVLGWHTPLHVAAAEEGIRLAPGSIHVAPSNRHMLLRPDGMLGLSDAKRVNFCRPAADVLFRSASAVYGAGVIGVVLTGYGQDGTSGTRAIQQSGGFVIAQSLESAEVDEMPLAARDIGGADLVLPLKQIATALNVLARSELAGPAGRHLCFQRRHRHNRPPLPPKACS